MSFLKMYSDKCSFKNIERSYTIPIYSIYEKGEYRTKNEINEEFTISFDVSDKDWNDFPGQIKDSISFLELYFPQIKKIMKKYQVTSAYLDFPIYYRIKKDIYNQNDHIPSKLIHLAGKLNLGIEMAFYDEDYIKSKFSDQ